MPILASAPTTDPRSTHSPAVQSLPPPVTITATFAPSIPPVSTAYQKHPAPLYGPMSFQTASADSYRGGGKGEAMMDVVLICAGLGMVGFALIFGRQIAPRGPIQRWGINVMLWLGTAQLVVGIFDVASRLLN